MESKNKNLCMICNNKLNYIPQMCCSGRDCSCMGMPSEPPVCSDRCYDIYIGRVNDLRDKPINEIIFIPIDSKIDFIGFKNVNNIINTHYADITK